MKNIKCWAIACAVLLLLITPALALDAQPPAAEQLLASSSHVEVAQGIEQLARSQHARALVVLEALEAGRLVADTDGKLYIQGDDGYVAAWSGEGAQPTGTSELALNNQSRRVLSAELSQLRLTSEDVDMRRAAARELSAFPNQESITLLRSLVETESDAEARDWMALAIAKVDLESTDPKLRKLAAQVIEDSSDVSLEAKLLALAGQGSATEKNLEVRAAMNSALRAVQQRIFWRSIVSNSVYGLSLGSVLVLAALGLAITFGLMRVINMAHGEMIMLGAYSTFIVRELLLGISESAAEWYLLFAIPFGFVTAFLMGVLLERLVIRHLYGRPLETLLATWGLSLILIQSVRLLFGAQNVTVANPNWLSGGWEAMPGLVIPYSRIFVLLFTGCVVGLISFILRGTSMGLKVRAVTQNREIASSLGVASHRIDMWTFGLGSGLAGLGGVALSQLGNVGPELGQQHIIDSFMVVVLGGVGNIWGTISAGVGLGMANKVLEPSVGAVLGKIMLLGMLILFIQYRPQGLFALKGRAAED